MSLVTTIVLVARFEREGVQELETWARTKEADTTCRFDLGEDLTPRNDKTGGTKYPEMSVYAAGWNYFPDPQGLIDAFKAIAWQSPESVFLIVQPQEGPARVERPSFTDIW